MLKYVGNESALLRELRRFKPNVYIRKALITKENMLLIITEDAKSTHEIRDKTWPKNAFMGGLTKTSITDMLYLGIKGVRKNLKLTEEEKNKLYEEYGIVSTVRIKGRDNKPTHTLKARIESKDDFQSILEEGLYINHFLHAVTPWENRIITCTNCQNFGHSNKDCFNRYRCTRCNEHHEPMKCEVDKEEYLCGNFNGRHASYYNKSPAKIEKSKKINSHWDLIEKSKAERAALYEPVRVANVVMQKNYASVVTDKNQSSDSKKNEGEQ